MKPGDFVYYIGSWEPDDLPSWEDAQNFEPHVIIRLKGELQVVNLVSSFAPEVANLAFTSSLNDDFFPTKKAAFLASSVRERKYGESLIALADRLQSLAEKM